jgi:transposase
MRSTRRLSLATVTPDWRRSWVPRNWFEWYLHRFEEYRLPDGPAARTALAEQIGADGRRLLTTILQTPELAWLQQFYAGDPISCRKADDLPPSAVVVSSPYDADARYSKERETIWTGYKIHVTETCDEDTPNIVTDVGTTVDHAVTGAVQRRLARRSLTPREHLVDTAYVPADHLVTSRTTHDCTLLGPIHETYSWQTRAGEGFGAAQFVVDWEREPATCSQGKTSKIWKPIKDSGGHDTINIRFDYEDRRDCSVRQHCVSSSRERALLIRPQPPYEALHEARGRQRTDEFKGRYAARAGIEGTMSQGVGLGDLRRTRYRGLARTRLVNLLIATALNVLRVSVWLDERPRAHARRSAFANLAPVAV